MKNWRRHVNKEFLETDRDYMDDLPYKSIDQSTFSLVSEATSYELVESEKGIHVEPRTENLPDLKKALKKSGDPTADFDLPQAKEALKEFAKSFEKAIKDGDKWEKTVEVARENEEIISEKDLFTPKEKGSFIENFLDFFRG